MTVPDLIEPPLPVAPLARPESVVPSAAATFTKHILLFGFIGPIAGMFLLPGIALFVAGPTEAVGMFLMLLGGILMGLGLVIALYAGAIPAAVVGVAVALLYLKGASERTLYVVSAIFGAISAPAWVLIVGPGFVREGNFTPTHMLMSAIGALAGLAMTYLSRRMRPKRPKPDDVILDQF